MGADYARGRVERLYLNYRYRVRATVAIQGYQRHHPSPPSDVSVLELGAAEGKTLLHIRDLFNSRGRYVGVELSDELLGQAPELPSNVSLLKGDVMDLPEELKQGEFDLCTALAVLEHLPDPMACVREAYDALRPGGVFVATCPNPFWDHLAGMFGMVADEHHEVEVTGKYMVDLAREAGFEDAVFKPFMWVFTGVLPYAGVDLDPELSLKIDALVEASKLLDFSFVNQALVAVKPY